MVVRWLDVRWSSLFLGFTFFAFSGFALPLGGGKFFLFGTVWELRCQGNDANSSSEVCTQSQVPQGGSLDELAIYDRPSG